MSVTRILSMVMVAAFAKLNLPLLNNRANVFALVGYAFGKVDILAETTATSVNENSFSWGAGADVAIIPDRLYLTADYVEYINRTGVSVDAVSSLGRRFGVRGGNACSLQDLSCIISSVPMLRR